MRSNPLLYLASASPRRQELLHQIGVDFALLAPGVEEDAEALEAALPAEHAADYVVRVTRLKLEAAVARQARRALPAAPVLCADTTVALGHHILGKPASAADAHAMLRRLANRTHRVLTAVAMAWNGARGPRTALALNITRVRMAALTDAQIDAYVASNEPYGKAGGYGVQGRAAAFIAHIDGSYSGVMGLPLFETAQLLQQAGVSA
ncbi:MAG: septum formation inhibitor Maf [Betaproteobacteria bacterium]|nr:septum formation inhibitor Maf [Betaproteobacteria bacterium]